MVSDEWSRHERNATVVGSSGAAACLLLLHLLPPHDADRLLVLSADVCSLSSRHAACMAHIYPGSNGSCRNVPRGVPSSLCLHYSPLHLRQPPSSFSSSSCPSLVTAPHHHQLTCTRSKHNSSSTNDDNGNSDHLLVFPVCCCLQHTHLLARPACPAPQLHCHQPLCRERVCGDGERGCCCNQEIGCVGKPSCWLGEMGVV